MIFNFGCAVLHAEMATRVRDSDSSRYFETCDLLVLTWDLIWDLSL